jgi:hypothetical protein
MVAWRKIRAPTKTGDDRQKSVTELTLTTFPTLKSSLSFFSNQNLIRADTASRTETVTLRNWPNPALSGKQLHRNHPSISILFGILPYR